VAERDASQDRQDGALLLVGGGRWARVTLSVLARMELPSPLLLISRHGGAALDAAIAGRGSRFETLEQALAGGPIRAALVVNNARDHAQTSLALLERAIPVLVEKPAALTMDQASAMTAAARAAGKRLMPGHVLKHCHYVENFAAEARSGLGDIAAIAITWRDEAGAMRYGENKSYDVGLGIAEDVGPHIATLLREILGAGFGGFTRTAIHRGGASVECDGLWREIPFSLVLERDGAKRERSVTFTDRQGREAKLDFSVEPGTISIAGQSRSADPDWPRPLGPLALQFRAFLQDPNLVEAELAELAEATLFTAGLADAVRAAQAAWLAEAPAGDPAALLTAMRELIAPGLAQSGRWTPGDAHGLDDTARKALELRNSPSKPQLAAILAGL